MLGSTVTGKTVIVLCGAGNNGGGGMVAARHLANRGARVHAMLVGDPQRLKDVPAQQWHILQAMDLAVVQAPKLHEADLLLDALIGYGLTNSPRGQAAVWIERVNTAARPVLALDTPSGLNLTTGRPEQPCMRATATLTLALPKAGLFAETARYVVGDLYLGDISVPSQLYRRFGINVGPIFAADTIVPLPRV